MPLILSARGCAYLSNDKCERKDVRIMCLLTVFSKSSRVLRPKLVRILFDEYSFERARQSPKCAEKVIRLWSKRLSLRLAVVRTYCTLVVELPLVGRNKHRRTAQTGDRAQFDQVRMSFAKAGLIEFLGHGCEMPGSDIRDIHLGTHVVAEYLRTEIVRYPDRNTSPVCNGFRRKSG